MNRRGFLQRLIGGVAALAIDTEQLLWRPEAKTIFNPPAPIPARAARLIGYDLSIWDLTVKLRYADGAEQRGLWCPDGFIRLPVGPPRTFRDLDDEIVFANGRPAGLL